jgi:hypothetical protein
MESDMGRIMIEITSTMPTMKKMIAIGTSSGTRMQPSRKPAANVTAT